MVVGTRLCCRRLDLSSNGLDGDLPESLANLHDLEYFDVALNRLSGGIPRFISTLTNLRCESLAGF